MYSLVDKWEALSADEKLEVSFAFGVLEVIWIVACYLPGVRSYAISLPFLLIVFAAAFAAAESMGRFL